MPSDRERRLALNEAVFRVANERMHAWEERHGEGGVEQYRCECAELECDATVSLTSEQYEAVRSNPRHFVIKPHHEVEDIETVLEDRGSYVVIEKCEEVTALVSLTDPRSPTA